VSHIAAARVAFGKLHDEIFTLRNAINVGEARKIPDLGFKAIASTSHGLSLTLGKSDLSATRMERLQTCGHSFGATELPENAHFEAGFARDPQASELM
jgi:2-methylisocitrate lyase-like PEP mutase family enzyme